MIKRIDTSGLAKGSDTTIAIFTQEEPTLDIYFLNVFDETYENLSFTIEQNGNFYKAATKLPFKDGFLLAKINGKYNVVKKVGNIIPTFMMGYKRGYTIEYKLYSTDGSLKSSGTLKEAVDGFYYCFTDYDAGYIEVLKQKISLATMQTKLEYDVTLGESEIGDVSLDDYELNATLGEASLSDVSLENYDLNVTLGNSTIEG